jgi:hypothetical protein
MSYLIIVINKPRGCIITWLSALIAGNVNALTSSLEVIQAEISTLFRYVLPTVPVP